MPPEFHRYHTGAYFLEAIVAMSTTLALLAGRGLKWRVPLALAVSLAVWFVGILLAPVFTSIPPFVEAGFTIFPLLPGWTGVGFCQILDRRCKSPDFLALY